MGTEGIGSSVIIALAAVMWFLYLVPTWFKRQEYLATERNAVRLQQTMRILAESAEVPSVVRMEATARTVAAQQRVLRQQQQQQKRRDGVHVPPLRFDAADRSLERGARMRRRLRRSRAMASVVLVVSVVGAGFGVSTLVSGGTWLLLVASLIVGAGAATLLAQAATVTRARMDLRSAATASAESAALHDHADYAPERRTGWTPVPVPKPLYLSQPAPVSRTSRSPLAAQSRDSLQRADSPAGLDQAAVLDHAAGLDHTAVLRAASAEAERALRNAQAAPNVARIGRPSAEKAAAAAPSRFASMGVLDPAAANAADLDDILRRRRAVG